MGSLYLLVAYEAGVDGTLFSMLVPAASTSGSPSLLLAIHLLMPVSRAGLHYVDVRGDFTGWTALNAGTRTSEELSSCVGDPTQPGMATMLVPARQRVKSMPTSLYLRGLCTSAMDLWSSHGLQLRGHFHPRCCRGDAHPF